VFEGSADQTSRLLGVLETGYFLSAAILFVAAAFFAIAAFAGRASRSLILVAAASLAFSVHCYLWGAAYVPPIHPFAQTGAWMEKLSLSGWWAGDALVLHYALVQRDIAPSRRVLTGLYGLLALGLYLNWANFGRDMVHMDEVSQFAFGVTVYLEAPSLSGPIMVANTLATLSYWITAWVFLRAALRGRRDLAPAGIGGLALACFSVHDALVHEHVLRGIYLTPIGFTLLTFGIACSLLIRFGKLSRDLEHSSELLAASNHALTLDASLRERERLETELRLADQGKNDFIATLSHELRNPLAALSSGAAVLDRSDLPDERARSASSIVLRQTRHMSRLVDDLLDVTRITRGKIELEIDVVDWRALIRATVEDQVSGLAKHHVELLLPEPEVWVRGDATRLVQCLENLLQNAARYANEGTTIRVRLIDVDGRATLSVEDEGIGFEPSDADTLFQPFTRTTRRDAAGLGLGLAVVHGLIGLHGGSVCASSEGPGKGARFSIELSVVAAPESKLVHAAPVEEELPAPGNCLVLLVEDNRDAAEGLAELLELEGCAVTIAATGRQGVKFAVEEVPDLILCDLGLPDIDGHEVARAIRNEPTLTGVKLVALSGFAQPDDRRRSAAAGFDEHLAKPAKQADLTRLVGEVARRRTEAHAPSFTLQAEA